MAISAEALLRLRTPRKRFQPWTYLAHLVVKRKKEVLVVLGDVDDPNAIARARRITGAGGVRAGVLNKNEWYRKGGKLVQHGRMGPHGDNLPH